MDAVRVDRQGDVHPVVDEEERAGRTGAGAQLAPQRQELAGAVSLVAELHRPRARRERGLDHVHHAARAGEPPVGDDEDAQRRTQLGRGHRVPDGDPGSRARSRSRLASATALLCSASVRLKWWLPSGHATKYR